MGLEAGGGVGDFVVARGGDDDVAASPILAGGELFARSGLVPLVLCGFRDARGVFEAWLAESVRKGGGVCFQRTR